MDERLATTIGDAVRVARHVRKLTQEDAADAVGVSLEFYARIERGKTLPSVPTLLKLAIALQVSADVLLGLERLSDTAKQRLRASEPSLPATTRRVVRRIARAKPSTIRLLASLLRELDASAPLARRKRPPHG